MAVCKRLYRRPQRTATIILCFCGIYFLSSKYFANLGVNHSKPRSILRGENQMDFRVTLAVSDVITHQDALRNNSLNIPSKNKTSTSPGAVNKQVMPKPNSSSSSFKNTTGGNAGKNASSTKVTGNNGAVSKDGKKTPATEAKKPKDPTDAEYLNYLKTDNSTPAINTHDYRTILTSDLCKKNKLYMVTIVHTAVQNLIQRDVIRRTWGSLTSHKNKSVVTVFMVGNSTTVKDNHAIANESKKYGDIVQGDFVDTYHNLTYKHVMALGWVSSNCPTAEYVLKTDDDSLINVFWLLWYLDHKPLADNQIFCHKLMAKPQRRVSKWKVMEKEYPLSQFPNYCEGFGYVVTLNGSRRLYEASVDTRYFWIDDVLVTGFYRIKAGMTILPFARGLLKQNLLDPDNVGQLMNSIFLYGSKTKPDVYDKAWKIIMALKNVVYT